MLCSRSPRVLASILLGIAMTVSSDRVWSQSVERTVYVSVLNQSGRSVDALAVEARELMETNKIQHVLVMGKEELVGVLHLQDLLKAKVV